MQHPDPPLVVDLFESGPAANCAAQGADDVTHFVDRLGARWVLLADPPGGVHPRCFAPVLFPPPLEDLNLGPVPCCIGPPQFLHELIPHLLRVPRGFQDRALVGQLDRVFFGVLILVHRQAPRLVSLFPRGPALLPPLRHLRGRLQPLEAVDQVRVVRVNLCEDAALGYVGALVREDVAERQFPHPGPVGHGLAAPPQLLDRGGGGPPVAHLPGGGDRLGRGLALTLRRVRARLQRRPPLRLADRLSSLVAA
mmetsp:Transcript_45135/g.130652  ORF Transcript_45135/g.130652 Transcript_45135/m.130652 type:complete len:252 (-) Transcript_45135:669-1424(-)